MVEKYDTPNNTQVNNALHHGNSMATADMSTFSAIEEVPVGANLNALVNEILATETPTKRDETKSISWAVDTTSIRIKPGNGSHSVQSDAYEEEE